MWAAAIAFCSTLADNGRPTMFDLGTSFRASVERDPNALAIVDGAMRMTYAQWYKRISAAVAGGASAPLIPCDQDKTCDQDMGSRHGI